MELQWKEVSTDHIVTDEWIDFRKSVYRLPDGRDISSYNRYIEDIIIRSQEVSGVGA